MAVGKRALIAVAMAIAGAAVGLEFGLAGGYPIPLTSAVGAVILGVVGDRIAHKG